MSTTGPIDWAIVADNTASIRQVDRFSGWEELKELFLKSTAVPKPPSMSVEDYAQAMMLTGLVVAFEFVNKRRVN